MIYIALLSCILQSIARDCSKFPSDYTKIIGKENEIIVQEISEYFDTVKYNDTVILTDQNAKVKLIPPINLKTTLQMAPNIKKVLTFSVLTNTQSQWLNKFQFLAIEQQNSQILKWTKNIVAGTQQRFPIFDTTIMIGKSDEVICQSSVILDISHLLVDCHQVDAQEPQNFFYLINENDPQQLSKIENSYPYEKNQQRQIISTQNYIYRITLKTNDNPAIIELFNYDIENKAITLESKINQELMKSLVNITQYSFDMVDAKISSSDEIAILDKTGNVFLLVYQSTNTTWYFRHLGFQLGESISFDFQFKTSEFAILQKQKVLLSLSTYESEEDLSNSKLYFTNSFLFLTSQTKMILFDKYLSILSIVAGDFSNLLVDYTQNDFLTYDTSNIKHYLCNSQYRIQYQNNDQGITGSSKLNVNGCQVTIDYKTIEKNSVDLIVVSQGNIQDFPFFTQRSYYNTYNNRPRRLVDGPKQKISFANQKNTKDSQLQGGNLTYIQISGDIQGKYKNENISLSDLIFVQTVSMAQSLDQPYAIITQNKQKKLSIFNCLNFYTEVCQLSYQTQLNFEITQKNTIIRFYYYEFTFISLIDEKTLFFYRFYSSSYQNRTITFKEEDEINNIDSIYLHKSYLLIFSKTQQKIGVYNSEYVELLYMINSESLKELGFLNWDPQLLFPNDFNQILFIVNGQEKNQLLMMNITKTDFSLGFNMRIAKSKDIRVINFYNRFAILQYYEGGAYTFEIYNREDASNVYLEKTPSFYNYKIDSLDSFFWVNYNGLLNVKAKSESKSVILTYLVELTDHNSLYCVQDWDPDNQFLTATQNAIFQFNKDNIQIYYVQKYPQLQYQVRFNDNSFIQDLDYTIQYTNEKILMVNKTFRLVNTNMDLQINKDKLNITTNLSTNQQNHYVQDMGNEWFSGVVTRFELYLPFSQNYTAQIINPIELIKSDYQSNTINIIDFSKQYIFVLKNDCYSLINKKTNEVAFNQNITQGYVCADIITSFDQQVLIKCTKDKKQYVGGVQCDNTDCKIGSSWLQIDGDILSGYIDSQNIFIIQRQIILTYSRSILDLAKAQNYGQITVKDLENFQYGLTIQNIKNNHYHVYCTDRSFKFTVLEYAIKDNRIQRTNKISLQLYDLINKDFFILDDQLFSCIRTINVQTTDTSYKADFILFATQGPHYGIHIEFSCLTDQCTMQSEKIVFVLQGYGTFQIMGSIFSDVKIVNNFIQISYLNSGRNILVQTVYQLPKTQSTKSAITFFSALKPFFYYERFEIQQELYLYDNQLFFLTNSENTMNRTLSLYKINFSPQLLLDGKINNSTGQLKVSNEFSFDQMPISINVVGGGGNDDEDITTTSYAGLWITLGLLGGGLLIVVGWCYYKKKLKKQKVETLI